MLQLFEAPYRSDQRVFRHDAASPVTGEFSPLCLPEHPDHDAIKHRARDGLPILRCRRSRLPQRRNISGQPPYRVFLCLRQSFGLARQGALMLVAECLPDCERRLPVPFQGTPRADCPIDRLVSTASQGCFIVCPFQPLLPLSVQLLPLEFDIFGNRRLTSIAQGERASSIKALTHLSTGRALIDSNGGAEGGRHLMTNVAPRVHRRCKW